jgi:adenylate cyclase
MPELEPNKGLLDGPNPLTARDVERETGLPAELLVSLRRALGLAVPELDEPAFSDIDVQAARLVIGFHGAGLPEDVMLEAARPLGFGLAQCARASVGVLERVATAEQREAIASRSEELTGELTALTENLAPLLGLMLLMHVREELRHRSTAELGEGVDGGVARLMYVGFVDMVEFTRMGEQAEVTTVGDVVSSFTDIVVGVAEPPARLLKTIGDEAMFVSPQAEPLLHTLQRVLEEAGRADPPLPSLRAGVAGGVALSREGDWYGPAVNLASRLTAAAKPGTVLANQPVFEASGGLPWSDLGPLHLRGIEGGVEGYELAPATPPRP